MKLKNGGALSPQPEASAKPGAMKLYDVFLFIFVGLGAVMLASVGFCAADWGYATATVLVTIFWAWVLYRKVHRNDPEEE